MSSIFWSCPEHLRLDEEQGKLAAQHKVLVSSEGTHRITSIINVRGCSVARDQMLVRFALMMAVGARQSERLEKHAGNSVGTSVSRSKHCVTCIDCGWRSWLVQTGTCHACNVVYLSRDVPGRRSHCCMQRIFLYLMRHVILLYHDCFVCMASTTSLSTCSISGNSWSALAIRAFLLHCLVSVYFSFISSLYILTGMSLYVIFFALFSHEDADENDDEAEGNACA
jgi:hypothetical protein